MPPSTVLLDSGSLPASPILLRSMLAGSAVVDGIEVVLWPAEDERRRRFTEAGVPCLLLLDDDAPAPVCGALEDWVRPPVAPDDLDVRCQALRARTACASRPEIDLDGALWFGGDRIDLPRGQQSLAQLLLDRYQAVVRRDELLDAYVAAGGRRSEEALKAALSRLGRRMDAVGLALRSIRGRGCMLEPAQRCVTGQRRVTEPSDSSP